MSVLRASRAAGIRCVGRAVHAVGNAGISEHTLQLKLCKLGCQDKSGVVRQVVAGLLLALGQSAADWANFSADRSVTVDALLSVGSKAMDDGNEGNQHVQLAFGRAVGHILSFSVAQTIEEDMETAAASERGAAGRGVDSSMGGSGGSNVGSGEGSGGKKIVQVAVAVEQRNLMTRHEPLRIGLDFD